MAKVIEFHVPDSFRNLPPEAPIERRGKVIMFLPRIAVLGEPGSNQSQHATQMQNISESRG